MKPILTIGILSYPKSQSRCDSLKRCLYSLRNLLGVRFRLLVSIESISMDDDLGLMSYIQGFSAQYSPRVIVHPNPRGVAQNVCNLIHHSRTDYLMIVQDDMEFVRPIDLRVPLHVFEKDPLAAAVYLDASYQPVTRRRYDDSSTIGPDPCNESFYKRITTESNYLYCDAVHIRGPLFLQEIGSDPPHLNHEWMTNIAAKNAVDEGRCTIWGSPNSTNVIHHPEPSVRQPVPPG